MGSGRLNKDTWRGGLREEIHRNPHNDVTPDLKPNKVLLPIKLLGLPGSETFFYRGPSKRARLRLLRKICRPWKQTVIAIADPSTFQLPPWQDEIWTYIFTILQITSPMGACPLSYRVIKNEPLSRRKSEGFTTEDQESNLTNTEHSWKSGTSTPPAGTHTPWSYGLDAQEMLWSNTLPPTKYYTFPG